MDNPLFLVNNGLLLKGSGSGSGGSGGGGGSGTGVYFAINSTVGSPQAIAPYMWRNTLIVNPILGTGFSGNGHLLLFVSSPVHSQISSNEWQTDLSIALNDLITFADAAIVGQPNPFEEAEEEDPIGGGGIIIGPPGGGGVIGGGLNQPDEIFFNVATYLHAPNGLQTLNRYEIDNMNMGWTGFQARPVVGFAFPPSAVCVGANYPLQDSLAISTTYPDPGFVSGVGISSDWGICGTGTLNTATTNNSNSQPITMLNFRDFRQILGPPQVGQTFTIRYKAEIVNTAGVTETAFHTVVITIT